MKTFPANLTKTQANILMSLIDSMTPEFYESFGLKQMDVADLYFAVDAAFVAHENFEGLED